MEPEGSAACTAAGSETKVGRVGGRQDDRRPTMAPAASLLPPTFLWIFGSPGEWPEGTGWPVLVALKSCWHRRKELGGAAQDETRGQIPGLPFFSPREAWEQLLLRSFLLSCIPCLQLLEGQGQGEQEVLIYHIAAVVSSSFIAWSDPLVECVKCVDFVECAQKECDAQRSRATQSVPLFHGTRTQAGHFDSSLTSESNSSQSSFSLACICLSSSLPSSL